MIPTVAEKYIAEDVRYKPGLTAPDLSCYGMIFKRAKVGNLHYNKKLVANNAFSMIARIQDQIYLADNGYALLFKSEGI
jgi:hypothetical protein